MFRLQTRTKRSLFRPAAALAIALCAWVTSLTGCTPPAPQPKAPQAEQGPDEPSKQRPLVGQLAEGEPHSSLSVEADDAVWGDPHALVTLVAFLDFQCSFCRQGYGLLLKLREGYSERELRIVFKHMPLETHDLALPAAVAGQAVMMEKGSGAFFDFANRAFSHQASMSYETLAEWAREAGVERSAYNRAVGDEETMQRIVADVVAGRRLGVDATPTFFVNGTLVAGAQPLEVFRKEINDELEAMKKVSSWKEAYQGRLRENMQVSLVQTLLESDPLDYRLPVGNSPVFGPATAPVTMVMFSDFECPFCKQAEATVWELQKQYGDQLRLVFKHMPLPFHKAARPAARLSELVHRKRGDEPFFAISRDLFESSPTLDAETLRQIGRKHGLSSEEIEKALSGQDDDLDQVLMRDQELGEDVLARGTPHFFINGKRLAGARPIEQFQALIEHARKRAQKLLDEGVAPDRVYAELQDDAESPGRPQKVDMTVPSAGRPVKGPRNAPVEVHVFSDFECPYCRRGEQVFGEVAASYPDKIRLVWHDFPLPFHQQALPAARAGREAYRQKGNEGFWKMHDALFALDQGTARVTNEEILEHAKRLNLDVTKMRRAIESDEHDDSIEKDRQLAQELGIDGTPAYLIGGYLVSGAGPAHKFRRVIELAIGSEDKSSSESETKTPEP